MSMVYCRGCGKQIHSSAESCPHCGAVVEKKLYGTKNKIVAGVLALIFGTFGVHKFYLGQIGLGILYLLFFWTLIPAIVAFIEGIIYLCMSDDAFNEKYNTRHV